MAEAERIAGVDACRGGWIAVVWDGSGMAGAKLCRSFSEVLAIEAAIIAVDMPIGLPRLSTREADRAARLILGARRASVFPVPARAAFAAQDYREACAINRLHSE